MDSGAIPFFTILIAVRNGAATLERCLRSIGSQTCRDWEIVIIDGASTDGTQDIVRRHEESVAASCSEPDRGIADAWNKGVHLARGEWILFLGADDCLRAPDTLATAKRLLETVDQEVGIAYGNVEMVNRAGDFLHMVGQPWSVAGPLFRARMSLPHQGVFHRRSWFAAVGAFDVQLRLCADYDFLLRALQRHPPAYLEGLVVASVQHGGLSSTPRNSMSLLREARVAQRKHGLHRPPLPWILAWVKVRIRQLLWMIVGENNARRLLDLGRRLSGKQPVWTRT